MGRFHQGLQRNGSQHASSQRGGQIIHFGSSAPDGNGSPTSPGGQNADPGLLTDKYRRNGKLQSCEPCRKSKLACDHRLDGCGRCRKRRRVDLCVYHPNPMTKQHTRSPSNANSAATASSSSTTALPASSQQLSGGHESTSVIASVEAADPSWQQSSASSQKALASAHLPFDAPTPARFHRALSEPCMELRRESVRAVNTGFVGDTSYSAILIEGLGGNAELLDANVEGIMEPNLKVPSSKIVKGAAAVEFLKNKKMIQRVLNLWYEQFEGSVGIFVKPFLDIWTEELWKHHMPALSSSRAEARRRMSEQLWRNTRSPMEFDGSTTLAEWARLAAGQNMRWSTVGLIAIFVGLCAKVLDTELLGFKSREEKHALASEMMEVGETCLQFCRDCEAVDDLFVWLLYAYSDLLSCTKGENHYAFYQASGETCSAIVALGFHQKIQPSEKIPWFLSEGRRRLVGAIWLAEVSVASFLGRPPRISHRYTVIDVPLDMSDEQFQLSGQELSDFLNSLDERGYDTSGRGPVRQTYYRSYYPFGRLREDVLDLALGHYTVSEVVTRAAQIQAELDAEWDRLPPQLAKVKEEPLDMTGRPMDVLLRNMIRQGVRATQIILQRVLIRRTGAKPDELVATAQRIFSDILALSLKHDIVSISQDKMTGVLVFHGLRSAAIMAIELLRQEQMAVYPEKPLLPRSKTIQELAVFASRLGSVDPDDGSYATCIQAKHVIEKILDKILSPDLKKNASLPTPSESNYNALPDAAAFAAPLPMQTNMLMGAEHGVAEDYRMGGGVDAAFGMDVPQDQDFMHWLNGMDASWNGF